MLDFIRKMLEREPARIVGYGSSFVVFLALQAAKQAGIELGTDVQSAISLLAGLAIAELIRRFVFAPDTVQVIANAATQLPPGTQVDIGQPPNTDASPPLSPAGGITPPGGEG